MNLYPGGNTKTDTPFDLCKNAGILAIGWSKVNRSVRTHSPDVYAKSAERIIPRVYPEGGRELKKWRGQFGILSRVEKGDLVWTKRSRGQYYLNRILDTRVTLLYGDEYQLNDFGSGRRCEWNEVPDDLDVPAEVKRNTRGTIHAVKDPKGTACTTSEQLYNEFRGRDIYRPKKFEGDLFDFLAPQDVEDLVGLFLQVRKKLLIIPSTSKQSMSPVEFLMIDGGSGEEFGVQVKTGNQIINLSDYATSPRKNYFFQAKPRIPTKSDEKTIFIEREELIQFAKEEPNKLPRGIRRRVKSLYGSV